MTAETSSSLTDAGPPVGALFVDAALGPAAGFTPDRSTAKWVGSLARQPRAVGRRLGGLGGEARRIVAGTSTLSPERGDRRFRDIAWTENPFLKRLVQLYLAGGQTLDQLVDDADLDLRDSKRVRFLLENIVEAVAPSNLPLVNPASAKAAIDTGGLSLVRGGKQFLKDLSSSPRIPEMVDSSGFVVGENIAATPGAVVFRNEVLELIQYQPQAEQVYDVPVLVVPPTINKFYAIDLAPGRSLVEFGAQQGRQLFVISWRNPDSRHAGWNFDTYVRAILDAFDAVEEITGSTKTMLGGICSGGILATITAAYLAATDQQDRLAGLCLAVTVIDNAGTGTVAALVDPRIAAKAKARSASKGYLDGRALAEVFAWLRPGDLVWNYWVNNYLLGNRPPAMDLLFWNSDTTRMAAGLHADFIDMAVDNQLTQPGAVAVLGVPIDLRAITVDSYIVAGVTDHITPWESCYRTTQLLGGKTKFVLSTSGHVAAMVNPPGNPKSTYRTNDENVDDSDTWLARAETHQGTWWTDLSVWLDARCGELMPAPDRLGTAGLPPLADAPGTYVLEK
ncbi:PHA/PHB synthase family protein [Nocardioides sp. CPCC 206347]|uniref:PHA/PHB synthase family protein n=1 Tax=unclassified Nocardioides TaxID=2615069 RepID=UPI0036211F5C